MDANSVEPEQPADRKPSVKIDQQICKACGLCIVYCPRKVLRRGEKVNDLGYAATEYVGEGCSGCGTCFYVCPEPGAVTVTRPERPAKHVEDAGS